jgi:hypothetical protein
MEMVAHAGSLLLGGVAAVMIIGLMLLFIQPRRKRPQDDQLLKQIADALRASADFKKKPEMTKLEGVTSGALSGH